MVSLAALYFLGIHITMSFLNLLIEKNSFFYLNLSLRISVFCPTTPRPRLRQRNLWKSG